MSNRLIIVVSGRKKSGIGSLHKIILKEYFNKVIGKERFALEKLEKELVLIDTFNNNEVVSTTMPSQHASDILKTYSVKTYSFKDPIKDFCIKSFGLDHAQCYGSEDDRNSQTHISWDDLPSDIREKYSRSRRGSGGFKPATGFMTSNELMNVLDFDILRKMDANCWARQLYSSIEKDGFKLAIVSEAEFPNEITIGTERGAKVIRIRKGSKDDTTLESFPEGEFSLVVDTIQDKNLVPKLHNWFFEKGLIK